MVIGQGEIWWADLGEPVRWPNVSLILALDKDQLTERTGKLPRRQLEAVLRGIDVVLGR